MQKRSLWFVIVALVGVAGLLAGLSLVYSLSTLGGETAEPTLAPVAAQVQTTTEAAQPTAVLQTASATPVVVSATDGDATGAPATPDGVLVVSGTPPLTRPTLIEHEVQTDESLWTIAASYNVTLQAIIDANQIADPEQIFPGQVLLIPTASWEAAGTDSLDDSATPEPQTTTPVNPAPTSPQDTGSLPPDWPPSITAGDLSGNYPLLQQTASGHLLIHYQPGTHPASIINELGQRIDQIFTDLQTRMGGTLPRQVDVYLGGTLFGSNPALQGLTQSHEFRSFVLVNGAFHRGERDYIIGHELTHVAATHILGPASSTMIHEGLATYLPQRYLTEDAGYLPIEQICAAAYRTNAFRSAGQLRLYGYGPDAFGGHIRSFFNYNLSGCFVGYLLEVYGMERLDQVYDTGDYSGVYAMSFSELDSAWQARLEATQLQINATDFVSLVEEIAAEYEAYLNASTGGHHAGYSAYLSLNRARLEANRGNLNAARRELETYRSMRR